MGNRLPRPLDHDLEITLNQQLRRRELNQPRSKIISKGQGRPLENSKPLIDFPRVDSSRDASWNKQSDLSHAPSEKPELRPRPL